MSKTQANKLKKLTPVSDAQLGIYEDQLTIALSDPDVKNIALSGPYGAGKSSILATYKKKHPEKDFLHISFAHFQDIAKDDEQLPNETKLEGKIINQLIHQMPAETIPQTHFQLLKEVDRGKIKKYIYWGVVLVALLAFICFHEAWRGLVDNLSMEALRSLLRMTQHKEAVLVAAVICVVLAVQGLTEYIYLQRNQRILRKINLKGTNLDIELFNAESDSYFDRYLNEVLYLLDHVDVDAVVFEDIDRYDKNLIFERLREINALANRIREQGSSRGMDREKKPLRFLYLIRDDVFSSKDRTKFFDVIIPVVPVMDGSNSYALLIRLFNQIEEAARPSDDFLRGVSLYIDDMRLLGNIYNEYLVYYRKYQQNNVIELNTDKLLAMMVYKNLFPEDHSMLHQGRGYVYTLFHNKPQFVSRQQEELKEELCLLEQQLEDIRQEVFQDMDELDAAYYSEERRTRIQATGEEEGAFESRVKYVAAIKANSYDIEFYKVDRYNNFVEWSKENVKAKFDQLLENSDYQKHKLRIEKKADAEGIRQRISEIKNSIEHLESMPLHIIVDNKNADQIFGTAYMKVLGEEEPYVDVKRSSYFPLIPYLVRNGYIDESYQDYMSYYYADGLRREDKIFMRSLLEHNYKGANYHLEEPCKVLNWMHNSQFETAECLNYQLLDALLLIVYHPQDIQGSIKRQDVDYEGRLNRLVKYIFENNEKEFFEGYLLQGRCADDFVMRLNAECLNVASWVLADETLDDKTKRKYALQTIIQGEKYCSRDVVDLRQLAEYVGRNTQFLYVEYTEEEGKCFVAGLIHFKVKFDNISLSEEERHIAETLGEEVASKWNEQVLRQVYCRQLYAMNIRNVIVMLHVFYGLGMNEIRHSELLTQVYERKDEPLKRYVDENLEDFLGALTAQGTLLEDEEKVILSVLNREDFSQECKEKYIAALACREELSNLELVKDKVLWSRLMKGHMQATSNNLTEYYFWSGNGMDEVLIDYINSSSKPIKPVEEKMVNKYGKDAVKRLHIDIIGCNAISKEKYSALARSFSLKCAADAIDIIDEDKMQVLISKKTIQMTLANLQYIRVNYPKLAFVFARRNIAEYISLSLSGTEGYQEEEFLSVIVSDKGILDNFLNDSNEPLERKQKALAKCVDNLRLSMLVRYLNALKLTDFLNLLAGERLTLVQTPGNKALLDAFLSKNWIVSYDVDQQDATLYKAQGKAILNNKNKKNTGSKSSRKQGPKSSLQNSKPPV